MRERGRDIFGAAALAGVLVAALLTVLPEPANAAKDQGRLTPIVVSPVPQKRIVPARGSDGRWHVMYEFQLTNTLDGPADLRSVSVLDPRKGRTLLSLNAEQLITGEYLHTMHRTSATTTVFERDQTRLLILNLAFNSKRKIPRRISHRFVVNGDDPFGHQPSTFTYKAGKTHLSRKKPPVLKPPLEGPGWLASNAPPGPTSHVNAILGLDGKLQAAERWAIDWIQIDPSGRIFTGPKTDVDSWYGYGQKVLAAHSGRVVEAVDGRPNQTPGMMPSNLTFRELPGNYVAVKMKGGYTAAYAHMIPGSVSVDVGDKVKAGQKLGLLGNSGVSLAPHLHFHIVDGPSIFASDGYPYVIDSFDHAAQSNIDSLFAALEGEAGFPTRDQMSPVPRRRELPLDFTINDFPSGP